MKLTNKVNKLSELSPKKTAITLEKLELKQGMQLQSLSSEKLFSCFADQPWSIWLDSCNSDHIDNQFDILVWQPAITLTTFGLTTTIKQTNVADIASNEDPLSLVEQTKRSFYSQYSLPCQKSLQQVKLPFIGGALGYFAYDLGRRFEKIDKIATPDITLPEMAVGIYSQAIVIDKANNNVYLVCPEDQRETLEQQLANLFQGITISALTTESAKPVRGKNEATDFKLTSDWQSNMSKESYKEKFQQVQSYLKRGDCYQINLAQRFSAKYQGNEFQAYKVLRKTNNAPFSAFMRFDNTAILSISPERFLSVKNRKVQSKPIKGTCPRHEDPLIDRENAKQLQTSIKDRAENVMIVDLLRNDISRVCQAGTVKVPDLFSIESFPAVHHLVSTVEGQLTENATPADLLRASFPGGSITGAPKIRAMEIIETLEPQRRSVYCGSIGYLSACGNMDTSITIRTLICNDEVIHCYAGGGLVADSTFENEYQETFDKVQKILPVLSQL